CARPGRDDGFLLYLPRAGDDPRPVRGLLRRPPDLQLDAHRRAVRGRARRLDRPRAPVHRHLPVPREGVRGSADGQPDLARADPGGRHPEARGRRGARGERPDAARLRGGLRRAPGAAVLLLRAVRVRRAGREERRHLRPVHRAHGGDAPVLPHRPAGPGQAARRGGPRQGAEVHQAADGRGVPRGREPARRAGVLHRPQERRDAVPHALPLPLVRQPPGAAPDVQGAAHRRHRGGHRVDRHRPRRRGPVEGTMDQTVLIQSILIPAAQILLILMVLPLLIAYLQLVERKVLGFMQVRLAPRRVGWHGLLQPIADAVKLLIKEDTIPEKSDRFLFTLAPIVTVIPALTALAVIPFASESFTLFGYTVRPFITDINIALVFLLSISSLGIYGIILGGWASNSKYSLLGALRSSAQMISYEVPLGFAVVGVMMLTGTASMVGIVNAQKEAGVWYVLPQILGFFCYFIAAVAETNRVPFDLPEAEALLVAAFHT